MDNNDNNNAIDNSTLKIATLEKEYDLYLKLYQEAYKNYITVLNSSSSNPCEKYKLESKGVSQECYNKIWADQKCTTQAPDATGDWQKDQTYDGLVNDTYLWATLTDTEHRNGCYGDTTDYNTNTEPTYSIGKEFTELPGRTWWGTHALKEGPADTKDDCISMCASDDKCTGATFNPVKRYCWTRSGDGTVTAGESDDSALIPKLKGIMITLNGLNDKLMDINKQLKEETQKMQPVVKEEEIANEEGQQKFDAQYNALSDDKIKMAKLLNEYKSIESDLYDQTLVVEQQNLSYKLWFLLAIIIVVVCFTKPSVVACVGFTILLLIICKFKFI